MPGDAFARLVLEELPQSARVGLTLGFVRTYGVPEIARVLHGSGELLTAPKARAKATGATMFALIRHGVESAEGRALVARLREVHRRPGVDGELMAYVLGCFTVCPVAFVDAYGRRRATPAERDGAFAFLDALGAALELPSVGRDFAEVARWMAEFERSRFGRSEAGQALWAATNGLLASRLPRPVRRLAPFVAAALLDASLADALGVRRPPRPVRWLTGRALGLLR
ncbi:oxygenase MpaB family protein [Kitasatospora sp. NPDC048365]|uniref:oxygenase MpaB family protein n=1 Tax=Kitasatospora sp. NPDC048365 TaxID=3364050 RepID=UPI00371483A7